LNETFRRDFGQVLSPFQFAPKPFGAGEDNLFPGYPVGWCTRFLSHRYKSSEINLWPQIYEVTGIKKVKPEDSYFKMLKTI